jgi:ACS family hexuronate transporter-like MFS transporter
MKYSIENELSPLNHPLKNPEKDSGVRWLILVLLFTATVIAYIDRLTVSFLAPVIKEDLGISNMQYAGITTWFLLVYSVFQFFSGRMYDRIGIRKAYSLSITVWSVAGVLHAVSGGILGMSVFRGLLGLGEAGHWPGVIKTVAEWFPVNMRAFAMGIVNAGASVGSVIAPPFIVWLLLNFGWQSAFVITGALGFVWVVIWWFFYQPPASHTWVTPTERMIIKGVQEERESGRVLETTDDTNNGVLDLGRLYKTRQVWALTIARFLGDPIWWLYLVWLPLYLKNEKGFTMQQIGNLAWLPYLFAALGGIAGGWFSGYLIKRGFSVNKARKIAIIVGTFFLPAGLFVISASSPLTMWIYICLTLFGFQFWVNNVQTLPGDLYERKYIGSVSGMSQSGAGFGSMLFVLATGWVVDYYSYTPILIAAGVLGPLATISLFALVGTIKKRII